MEFRIVDTFTDSLGRLAAEEQKAAKTTAFDLQVNPAAWVCRCKPETHTTTGAAQLVEIRERTQGVIFPIFVQKEVEGVARRRTRVSAPRSRRSSRGLRHSTPTER